MARKANPKKLKARLSWLWEHRTHDVWEEIGGLHAWRYLPRAFSSRGPGWGVYDNVDQRFLTDAELCAIPMDQLQNARVPDASTLVH